MKQNLGKLDRIFRFIIGVWWLGADPFLLPLLGDWLEWGIFVVAWWALLESLVGYCWLHDKLGINNKSQ